MVVFSVPEWATKAKENLKHHVWQLAENNDIPFSLVYDSESINNCIDGIIGRMMGLKDLENERINQQDFQKALPMIDEAMKKERMRKKRIRKKRGKKTR